MLFLVYPLMRDFSSALAKGPKAPRDAAASVPKPEADFRVDRHTSAEAQTARKTSRQALREAQDAQSVLSGDQKNSVLGTSGLNRIVKILP